MLLIYDVPLFTAVPIWIWLRTYNMTLKNASNKIKDVNPGRAILTVMFLFWCRWLRFSSNLKFSFNLISILDFDKTGRVTDSFSKTFTCVFLLMGERSPLHLSSCLDVNNFCVCCCLFIWFYIFFSVCLDLASPYFLRFVCILLFVYFFCKFVYLFFSEFVCLILFICLFFRFMCACFCLFSSLDFIFVCLVIVFLLC